MRQNCTTLLFTLTVLLGSSWSCTSPALAGAETSVRTDLPRDGKPLLHIANKSRIPISLSLHIRNGRGEERISHELFVGTEYQTTKVKSASSITVNLLGDSAWRTQFMADSFLIVVEAANKNAKSLPTPIPRFVEIPLPPKHLDDPKIEDLRITVYDDHAVLMYPGTKKRFDFLNYDKKHPVFNND